MERILFICAMGLAAAHAARAQNNAIFIGGAGDGYAREGLAQLVSTAGIFSGGMGDGYASAGFTQPLSTAGIFFGGQGDGYSRNGFAQPASSTAIFSGGLGDGYARDAFAQPSSSVGIFSGGTGDGYAAGLGTNVLVRIQGLTLLEGPYNAGTLLMDDNLRVAGLIPLTEPFTALGYPNAAGSGGETTTPGVLAITGVAAAVDWVRVELRNAAGPATLMAVRHALVLRDGTIMDAFTGDDFIGLNAPPGNYYVVVRHRNHLGAMTAAPVALSSTAAVIDFTLGTTATFGTEARKIIGSARALWAGDVNGDHQLKYTGAGNDRDPILVAVGGTVPTNTLTGQYRAEDVNLDGVVKYTGVGNDRDPILVNIGGTVPTNVRTEQVP